MQLRTATAGIVLAMAAGAAQAQDTELKVWTLNYTADAQVNALQRAVEEYEARYPDVSIDLVMRGTDEHKTALRVASGSDTGPDIYMNWAGLGLGGEYVIAGMSADLSDYYGQYGWEDRLSAASLGFISLFADGKHGIPFRFSGEAVYYNKNLFEQAGITEEPQSYEELVAAAEALKEEGIPAFAFGGTVNWHVMRLMDVILETKCGAETHDALMEMSLDWSTTPCAAESFAEMQTWADEYFLKPFMGIDNRQATSLFFAERAAMMLEGDWHVNTINESADIANYAIFPFPTGTGRLYGFAEYWYISSKSEHPDEAAAFLDMFTSTDFQSEIVGSFGALSVNTGVELGENALDMHKEWTGIFAEAEGIFVNGDQAFPLDVTTEYFRVINEVASGNMEPQAAADALQAFIANR